MWVVRGFDKSSDDLVREILLPGFSGQEVRPFLKLPPDDPMYDAYPITPAVEEVLKKYVVEALDRERYDWFVEFDKD